MSSTLPYGSSSADVANGVEPLVPVKRKRQPRAAVACDICRSRKVKCDGRFPCSSCTQHAFECIYKERQQAIVHDSTAERGPSIDLYCHHHRCLTSTPNLARTSTSRCLNLAPPARSRALLEPDTPVSATDSSACETYGEPASQEKSPTQCTAAGLGSINLYTDGAEYYGRTGTFYFLSKLRAWAHSQHQPQTNAQASTSSIADDSVVNLFHSTDYSAINGTEGPEEASESRLATPRSSNAIPLSHDATPVQRFNEALTDLEIEVGRDCARLYFSNLHCIHPVLDQAAFLARCEHEVWTGKHKSPGVASSVRRRTGNRFLALYNIVLATGAITAGETSVLTGDRVLRFVERHEKDKEKFTGKAPSPSIRTARIFFERCKASLGDTFDRSCFETAQTLFLMSVFCQNALKPHACYMYSGMAIRTAFAIGIPNKLPEKTNDERLLWWALYSHEIEMSSSAGRQSFLQEPGCYSIQFPNGMISTGPSLNIIKSMVDFAHILTQVVRSTYQVEDDPGDVDLYQRSLELEGYLQDWKAKLPPELDFDTASLSEHEMVTKQKIVLKLRFLNAKVLIHRQFIISSTPHRPEHVFSCVNAAIETIRFVYENYLYRPYFRSWWYNCTYVLDAAMVLLYVILTKRSPYAFESITSDINKSLEIFKAMEVLAVARRCYDITSEVLDVATNLYRSQQGQRNNEPQDRTAMDPQDQIPDANVIGPVSEFAGENEIEDNVTGISGMSLPEELSTSLVDMNLMYNFWDDEGWSVWTSMGS
ncbi:hypothetical protein BU24DRAFT_451618 [Aaosphaeria arxii CBS 175.79]|uniref:Zn(2)-C6 fungal-type domain-containing protein n=1 Tax=Aaosphaeria arxii CBS 175.79 TaxID=1450172 RepID=A0A6A5XNW2_9PLEO|nr:uncharacterized protein BU24DRAFT_451618 [Aaosphaeria arxii CBS 175.79]KAF2014633.1 hypothetical protein BU24DRAFT_451618 [Aaosphaeria arxii CBS 175.79]